MYDGLTKEEYKELLKECNMCTKKWTLARRSKFRERRKEIIEKRSVHLNFLGLGKKVKNGR